MHKKSYLTILLALLLKVIVFAQINPVDTIPPPPPPPTECIGPEPFIVVETMPLFSGCTDTTLTTYAEQKSCSDKALLEYIWKNLDVSGLPPGTDPGVIVIGFIVTKDGSMEDVKVIRTGHPIITERAVEMIKKMPSWTPGTQRGRPVNVSYALPIRLHLE